MSQVITFRELVKLIHPDHNPDVKDPSGKMTMAVMFKNQPEELYKLAVRWGFVNSINRGSGYNNRTTRRPRPEPRYDWVADFNAVPRFNDNVIVTTKGMARVTVVRVTPKRVYFYYNGRRTFANKENVYVVKWQKVG